MAQQHCRVLSQLQGVSLIGVTSRTRKRSEDLAESYGIAGVYDTIDEMYQKTGADLLLITVKELGLVDAVKAAAAHDWSLFLEKPAGYKMSVAIEIRDLLQGKSRHNVLVGLNRRHYSSTVLGLEELKDVEGPRHIFVMDQQSLAGARKIGHPEDVVNNLMYANSIHTIDYLRVFGRGKIEKVVPDSNWKGEDTFVHGANVYFSSGDIGRYEAIWGGPGPWSCFVTTAAKRLEMRPLETLSVQVAGERNLKSIEIDPIDLDFKAGFYRQAEAVISVIRGNSAPGVMDIDQSFETMELIHAIYGI